MTASASDVAYDGIRSMLVGSELSPGQWLSQSRLARQRNRGPMPVVETMRRLESEGLLVKQSRRQARVREICPPKIGPNTGLVDSLPWQLARTGTA